MLTPALKSVETAMQSKAKLQLKHLLSIRDMLKIAQNYILHIEDSSSIAMNRFNVELTDFKVISLAKSTIA